MSMSTTRSLRNRSSRYSSPATFAENQAPPKPTEVQGSSHGGQATLNKWVEPALRNAVPSFEDTKGLERVGVLEHMAPLGVAPSQKLLQKLKVNLNRSSPRVTPVVQGEGTPPMDSTKMELASPVDTEPLPELNRDEDMMIISSPPRGRPAKKELDDMKQVIDITTPSPVKSTFELFQTSPRPQSIQDYIRQDRMKSVVDRAIAEANDHADLKVVPGLQQLWEDAKAKPQLWAILDSILTKTPTDAQFRVFKKYIKRGVRRHRRNSSGLNSSRTPSYLTSPQLHTSVFPDFSPGQDDPIGRVFTNSYSINSPFRMKSITSQQISPNHRDVLSPTAKMASSLPDTELHLHIKPKRKRSGSDSSTSSLSSAQSLPEDYSPETVEVDAENQAIEGRPVRSTGTRQATNRVPAVSRTRPFVDSQFDSSQPTTGIPTNLRLHHKKSKSTNKREDILYDPDRVEAKRREFESDSLVEYNYINRPESDERTAVQGQPAPNNGTLLRIPPPVIHPYPLLPTTATLLSPTGSQARPELSVLNGIGRKRAYDEMDKDEFDVVTPASSSPASFNLPPPPPPAGISDLTEQTRGATPRSTRLPPPSKARKSARVMVSPNKPKNGGITAGVSRAGAGRDVAIGNGTESGGEDNDEFCASCGGEGTLLCCDGCTNSFHHGCLEPPLNPDDEVDGEWYCPRCVARRNKEPIPVIGLLGQVLRRLEHTIPKAYALPFEIRDYFEGVKTGDEGEYEEVFLPRTQNTGAKMNRAGFIEEPTYKELRDPKGNFNICHRCQKTSNGRDIIPCDYCPAKWHMDCLDPPLAVPPRKRGGDKPTGFWRCPLHVEGDLTEIGRQVEAAPGDLGRVPRLRRPKVSNPVDVDLYRGFKNNGVIDVDLMKDEKTGMRELVLDHGIYRLPEKGIRLDFIDRVKKSWYEDKALPRLFNKSPRIRAQLYRPDDPVLHHPAARTLVKPKESDVFRDITAISAAETARTNAQLRHRSFREQNTVMSLLSLSGQPQKGLSIDPLADLTNTLVAEAPDEVVEQINLSEKDMLLRLQKLVNNRLAIVNNQELLRRKKLNKRATSEPGLLNGDITEQLNGDADGYGDDEGDGGSETNKPS